MRNVRISSKYPERPEAHTLYMSGAAGSIAYAEFRALGPCACPGVQSWVLISTDKAVQPTSVMGASKRVASG